MTPFEILPVARDEWRQAAQFYVDHSPRAQERFEAELDETLSWIQRSPRTWPLISPSVRRCFVRHFPYSVLFQIHPDRITIISVMHQKRHPDSWLKR